MTGNETPVRNALPDHWSGTVVRHVPELVSKVVVAAVAAGSIVTLPAGAVTVYGVLPALKVIFEARTSTVAPLDPTPLTLNTLLNQMVRPDAMGVPLKFDELETALSAEASPVDLDAPGFKACGALSRWHACEQKTIPNKNGSSRRVTSTADKGHTYSPTRGVRSIHRLPGGSPLRSALEGLRPPTTRPAIHEGPEPFRSHPRRRGAGVECAPFLPRARS